GVDQSINTADEEAGYACHLADVSASSRELLQPCDIGLSDFLVYFLRKQQRDIDVNALADQLLKCRDAFRRSRHLDHEVFSSYGLRQTAGLCEGSFGVSCQIR